MKCVIFPPKGGFADPRRRVFGIHIADVPRAAIYSPWDFLPMVLVNFSRFLGKGELRAEACSGDSVGGVYIDTTVFKRT